MMAINGGPIDILWILLCSFLVFLMQAGFLCLESGLTRAKNSINVAMKNIMALIVSLAIYFAWGWAVAFHNSWYGFIGVWTLPLINDLTPLQIAIGIFYGMFCSTAATIISGAIAERTKFFSYLLAVVIISTIIYPPVVHWCWATGPWDGRPIGILKGLGFIDFAGASVVHSVGGWSALALVLIVGPRRGRFPNGNIPSSNLPITTLGILLLMFGWLGFNGGSLLTFSPKVPVVLLNTFIGALAGSLTSLLIDLVQFKVRFFRIQMMINGTLAGLVAVTASANLISPLDAVWIGIGGCLITLLLESLLIRLQVDDAVNAIPVHLGAGVWGTLALAIAVPHTSLPTHSWDEQLAIQLLGVVVIGVWAFGLSFLLFYLIDKVFPFRTSPQAEEEGLNMSEHQVTTEYGALISFMQEQKNTGNFTQKARVENYTEAGQVAQIYNMVIDMLEKDREQVVKETSKISSIGLMAAEIIHDLKSPLQLIEGSLFIMEKETASNSNSTTKCLSKIRLASERIKSTLNLFLTYVRTSDLDPISAVSIKKIVEEAKQLNEFEFNKYRIKVKCIIADNLTVNGRQSQMIRIFLNLFINAINAIKELSERWIEIVATTIEKEGMSFIQILFTNSGRIDLEKQLAITQILTTPLIAQGEKKVSSGLGLCIAKTIVSDHQGSMALTIAEDVMGTQFKLLFPLDQGQIPPS